MTTNHSSECAGGLEPSRGQVHAGGMTFSYLEWGETGAPLLLLHGITSSARGWWRVAPELVALGYHVYALDMPGHGQSQLADMHRIDQIAGRIGQALSEALQQCRADAVRGLFVGSGDWDLTPLFSRMQRSGLNSVR